MYIPCEECFRRYQREYTEECDNTCDYARITKEYKEYTKSKVLDRQIVDINALICRLEVGVDALNSIAVDALNKITAKE